MKKNYDTIAWFYDRLARLVYGDTLVKAQRYLLQAVPAGAHILIIGGGTGWIIEELGNVHPEGLHITYIDASAKMVALARQRNAGRNTIEFMAAPIETAAIEKRYDVVLTPFLLDNFTDVMLEGLFSVMGGLLKPGGLWLYCDFKDTDKIWQQAMLKIMYLFFKTTCGIPASHLPDAEGRFMEYGYEAMASQHFLDGFIIAAVYKKRPAVPV